ncbi:YpbS family protein [Neobacillus pocheonensis]|uniref:YpbS family protein n=1 Tax=Neobacillus pocheonensis TaxID=363869 RepID=UPI003D2E1236
MSVHKAISEHVNKQNKKINDFLLLDNQRELYIEEALELCKQGKEFTTDKINSVTQQINNLAKQGIVPTRKFVTVDMVKEFASK